MPSDPTTLFIALITSMTVAGILMLWIWWQNRADPTLAWAGSAYLTCTIGAMIFAASGQLPTEVRQSLGPATVILGMALIWGTASALNRSTIAPWKLLLGPVIWLGFSVSPLAALPPVQMCVSSLLLAFNLVQAAREFLSGDPLPGRRPLATVLLIHTAAVLMRIPLALGALGPMEVYFTSPWVMLSALEGLAFIQTCALIIVSLTKERLEMRLRWAAETDPLTGLCNRRALFQRGAEAIAACARLRRPTAVAIFDLDDFKAINDSFGHAVGDAVIVAFASAARACLSPGDVAGRIGGEEFAIVLPGRDAGEAGAVAQSILDSFRSFAAQVEGHTVTPTASGGVAVDAGAAASLDALLALADKALYEAKGLGSNALRITAPPGPTA